MTVHSREPHQRFCSYVIIILQSCIHICQEEEWRPKFLYELSVTKYKHNQELVSLAFDSGQVTAIKESSYLHKIEY